MMRVPKYEVSGSEMLVWSTSHAKAKYTALRRARRDPKTYGCEHWDFDNPFYGFECRRIDRSEVKARQYEVEQQTNMCNPSVQKSYQWQNIQNWWWVSQVWFKNLVDDMIEKSYPDMYVAISPFETMPVKLQEMVSGEIKRLILHMLSNGTHRQKKNALRYISKIE